MQPIPVARLSGPPEVVRVVPHLCGFVPSESLVVLSLRGPRRRVGLTLRVDLPRPSQESAVSADLARRVRHDGGREALVVVYTGDADDAGGLPRAALVREVEQALESAGIGVQDALLVRGDRWWSYVCTDPGCCPSDGTPLDTAASPALALVQATQALEGRAVLPSRADLEAWLRPPQLLAATVARQRLEHAAAAWDADVRQRGVAAARAAAHAHWRTAVDAARDPRAEIAAPDVLAVALGDIEVRDAVLPWLLADEDALLRVLLRLGAACVAPYDAPVCTLVAAAAWLRGDGALANVALDRALASAPGYRLAHLLRAGLDGQVPPAAVRDWLARC